MRPPLAARAARIAVPAAVITALGVGVAGAVLPGDGAQVAYPAPASTASIELSPSETSRQQELSRRVTRPPVKVASMPKTQRFRLGDDRSDPEAQDHGRKYATTDLNVRTEAKTTRR